MSHHTCMLKIAGNNQAGNVICFNNMIVIIMTSAMTEIYNDNADIAK